MTEQAASAASAPETSAPASVPSTREALSSAFEKAGLDRKDTPQKDEEQDQREKVEARAPTGRDKADQERLADSEARREIIRKHVSAFVPDESGVAPIERENQSWEASAPFREKLRTYFPDGMTAPLQYLLKANADLEKNAGNTAAVSAICESVARWYMSNPPFLPRLKEAASDDRIVRSAFDRATLDLKDREALAEIIKEVGGKLPLDHVLARAVELHEGFTNDPMGMAGRLAGMFMPVTDAEIAQEKQTAEQQLQIAQERQSIERGLHTIVQHNLLPGLETPELQDAIVAVLESSSFQRSDSGPQDLKRAWEIARDRLATKQQREQQEQQAKALKAKAGKSVSGAPNIGAGSSGRGPHKTTREALSAALSGGI